MAYRMLPGGDVISAAWPSGTCADGLAGCGCGGKCSGLGLFESGTDYTQWGTPEWAIVAVAGYMLFSTVFTTGRAVGRVRALPDDVRAGVKRGRKRLGKRIAGE